MIGTATIPSLPPSFDRAPILSSVLAYFFLVNFWVTAIWLAAALAMPVWPQAARFTMDDSLVSAAGLSHQAQIGTVLALVIRTLPALVLLHHAQRLFRLFARGEVFAPAPIHHIRVIGAWLIVWAFASTAGHIALNLATGAHPVIGHVQFEPPLLAFGIATTIAATVMAEARRIADENASIL